MQTLKKIGTHSGTFHADESFACFLLLQTKLFKGAQIIRSRDPAVLAECDAVVDVGAVYDPAKFKFDHHQKEFQDTMQIGDKKFETRLSSAGLVYKHFGREVIQNLCLEKEKQIPEKDLDLLYLKLYEDFVEAFDGIDNGVNRYPSDVKAKYRDSTNLASRIGRLVPNWNEPFTDEVLMERFKLAVEMTGKEFSERVYFLALAWLPARDLLVSALEKRHSVHSSGRVICLEQSLPWKEHLFGLEEEMKLKPEERILYCLYPDPSGQWRIQCVPERSDSFVNRKTMPASWLGLRDDDLSAASGIPGCVFVHVTGFIGGNRTYEGALEMAKKSLLA